MKRFPNYKTVIEYEDKVSKNSIPETLELNYLVQILRKEQIVYKTTPIHILRKIIESNSEIKHLSDQLCSAAFIQNYPKYFICSYYKNDKSKIYSIKLSGDILKLELQKMGLKCRKNNGDLYYILEKYSLSPNNYHKGFSIENRIKQILGRKLDYEIETVLFGSVAIKLATYNSDCDIMLKFPNYFNQDAIDNKFQGVINILNNSGYKFLSGNKTKAGERLIKLKDYNSTFTIDIGIYREMSIWKSKLVNSYANLHPDIKKAILLIKIWAHRRKLNNPSTTQVMNSFCHVLMLITYLIITGAIPNLRTVSSDLDYWKAGKIKYHPNIDLLEDSELDRMSYKFYELVSDGNEDIPIYFRENLEVELGDDWDIKKAITGYFYFMGFRFDYLNWDISIYHGGIIKSSQFIDSITSQTKLLRIRHPFKPDQIESNSALPWCVDGLKWEFMRGYHLLSSNNWKELMKEAKCPDAKDIYEYNMYTYTLLY